MNRITFLIDGFNIYHSAIDVSSLLGGVTTKWLNLHSLCHSYLQLFGKDARLEEIYYFSALATHLEHKDPDKIERHKIYIKCLELKGINVELGRFKSMDVRCKKCGKYFIKHEEKETDVAIAVTLFELLYSNACDTTVLVTGDTDLAPAVKNAKSLFIDKKVVFAFPYKRKNQELVDLAPGSFSIGREQYPKHQFPDTVILDDGSKLYKPASW